ncbi:MAG: pilus assembly protein [Bradyrhizobium sp.]|uniref:TadE/TadG family type IV pilus assembly protein n=1 Tax=Bradyrhizobium sp. TaxID=376 RepID=UPI001DA2EF5A|nr:TadE/TadG family type IV pilus assembly protein [Bradyrhizobium sp.]MBV9561391.1 pilus assembly protein [Bradyrhizobium sp.]
MRTPRDSSDVSFGISSDTRRRRDRATALLADECGATAVEFAIVAVPFVALVIGIIQVFLVFFGQQLLESVVQGASRQILTGQAQAAGMDQTTFKSNVVCPQIRIIFACANLMVDVQSTSSFAAASTSQPPLTFNSSGQVTNTWHYSPGGPGDIVVVTLMYQWPVFMGPLGFTLANLPNGNRKIAATAVFQNETIDQ